MRVVELYSCIVYSSVSVFMHHVAQCLNDAKVQLQQCTCTRSAQVGGCEPGSPLEGNVTATGDTALDWAGVVTPAVATYTVCWCGRGTCDDYVVVAADAAQDEPGTEWEGMHPGAYPRQSALTQRVQESLEASKESRPSQNVSCALYCSSQVLPFSQKFIRRRPSVRRSATSRAWIAAARPGLARPATRRAGCSSRASPST